MKAGLRRYWVVGRMESKRTSSIFRRDEECRRRGRKKGRKETMTAKGDRTGNLKLKWYPKHLKVYDREKESIRQTVL